MFAMATTQENGRSTGSVAEEERQAGARQKTHSRFAYSSAPGMEYAPGASGELPAETLKKWLRDMLVIREFELRTMAAYQQAKIGGFCHIYTGQEGVAVGTMAACEDDDPIVGAYRDHGQALARGMDPLACMAEMYGRLAGCAKGKGGSMHMFDKPNHFYGGHGIVGAQTPLGAGLAFGAKYEREVLGKALDGGEAKKKVALCYLGDGALNQGAFHEAQNLASVFSLPVIFVLENNKYSMGTAIERGTSMAEDLSAKAAAYGMGYAELNGMNVMELYDGFKPVVDTVREAQQPAFVNIHCYRYQGHSMSDPQKYRSKDEVQIYQDADPINLLKKFVVDEKSFLDEDGYKALQKEVKALVKDVQQRAEGMDEQDPAAELAADVYMQPVRNLSPTTGYVWGSKNPLL
jgi:pyruvate dehydrogenase E1 component alpha subunit